MYELLQKRGSLLFEKIRNRQIIALKIFEQQATEEGGPLQSFMLKILRLL